VRSLWIAGRVAWAWAALAGCSAADPPPSAVRYHAQLDALARSDQTCGPACCEAYRRQPPGPGSDCVVGGAGPDRLALATLGAAVTLVAGNGGDDVIVGSEGDDILLGGDGADDIVGGAGADVCDGGFGPDRIDGGDAADQLWGGPGDDDLVGGSGNDWIAGGAGDDDIRGGAGDDELSGGPGADVIEDLSGRGVVFGGAGSDTLTTGPEDDRLDGGDGDDRLDSGDGDDVLVPGRGRDRTDAGAGDDVILVRSVYDLEPGEEIEGGPGHDTVVSPVGEVDLRRMGVVLSGVEAFRASPAARQPDCGAAGHGHATVEIIGVTTGEARLVSAEVSGSSEAARDGIDRTGYAIVVTTSYDPAVAPGETVLVAMDGTARLDGGQLAGRHPMTVHDAGEVATDIREAGVRVRLELVDTGVTVEGVRIWRPAVDAAFAANAVFTVLPAVGPVPPWYLTSRWMPEHGRRLDAAYAFEAGGLVQR
jgi:hypothetical protein